MIVNQTGIKITATIASNSEPVTILKYKINEPINSPIFAIQVRKVRLFNFGRVRIGARPYGTHWGTYWGGLQIEASNLGFDWPRNDIPIGLERNWASLSLKAYLRKKFGPVLFFSEPVRPFMATGLAFYGVVKGDQSMTLTNRLLCQTEFSSLAIETKQIAWNHSWCSQLRSRMFFAIPSSRHQNNCKIHDSIQT